MRCSFVLLFAFSLCQSLIFAQENSVAYISDEVSDNHEADSYESNSYEIESPNLLSTPCCGTSANHASAGKDSAVWGQVDYLLWWTKGSNLPPLITGSTPGTPQNQAGVLGQPNTSILYGNEVVNDDVRSGFRLTGGFWLNDCHTIGIGADYFELGAGNDHGEGSGNGSPIISRPFYDVQTGAQAAELVSFPGVLSGTVTADSRDTFRSAGSWLRLNLVNCKRSNNCCSTNNCCSNRCCTDSGYGVDMLLGFRHYRLNDSLTIREDLTDISSGPTAGTTYDIRDSFSTQNQFYGGELGFRPHINRGNWSLGLLTKIAIGNNRTTVTIDGSTTTTAPGFAPVTDANGILATQSNIGQYENDQFTLIPQIGVELGYQLTKNIDLFVGYDLIYWAHVQRAAEQIDLNVDTRNWPPVQAGATHFPEPQLTSTDFWAQGLKFSAGWNY